MSHMSWAEPFRNVFAAIDNYMVMAMHLLDESVAEWRARHHGTNSNGTNGTNETNSYQLQHPYQESIDRHQRFARDIMPFLHVASQYMSSPLFFFPSPIAGAVWNATESNATESNVSISGSSSYYYYSVPNPSIIDRVVDSILNAQGLLPATPGDQGGGRRLMQLSTPTGSISNATQPVALDWKQQLGIVKPLTEGIGAVQAYSSLVIAAAGGKPLGIDF